VGGGVLCGAVVGTTAARRQGDEGQRGTSGPWALGVQRSGVRGQRLGMRGVEVGSLGSGDRGGLGSDEVPQARGGHRNRGTEVQGCNLRGFGGDQEGQTEVRGHRITECGLEGVQGDRGRIVLKPGFT